MVPVDWMPSTLATPMAPVSTGSSPNASKMRPASGTRARLSSGPWAASIPFARASWPMTVPVARAIDGSKVAATPMAAGSCVTPCMWIGDSVRPVGERQRRDAQ